MVDIRFVVSGGTVGTGVVVDGGSVSVSIFPVLYSLHM